MKILLKFMIKLFKGVQVSDHVKDWIRGFAIERAFIVEFQNAASNNHCLHNIFCWYKWPTEQMSRPWKVLSSIFPLMSNEYKIHIQFNLGAYKNVSIILRLG